jgi:hypothetical protein
MSLNQQLIAEFSPCTPRAPQLRDLSIQTVRPSGLFSERPGTGRSPERLGLAIKAGPRRPQAARRTCTAYHDQRIGAGHSMMTVFVNRYPASKFRVARPPSAERAVEAWSLRRSPANRKYHPDLRVLLKKGGSLMIVETSMRPLLNFLCGFAFLPLVSLAQTSKTGRCTADSRLGKFVGPRVERGGSRSLPFAAVWTY